MFVDRIELAKNCCCKYLFAFDDFTFSVVKSFPIAFDKDEHCKSNSDPIKCQSQI